MPELAPSPDRLSEPSAGDFLTVRGTETGTINMEMTGLVTVRCAAMDDPPTVRMVMPPAPAALAAESPLLFKRYRPLRELGRGGMGVVWLVQDEVLRIPLALKMIPDDLASSDDHLEGLRKEVLRGIALTHPGIVRIYSFEREEGSAAISMEYVDGESLADLKVRQPDHCFEPEQLRPWLEQLCAVLDYAHREARIAHRDLKPRNVMITREGRLKVADFGIASSLSEETCGISVRNDSSGTPPYMSPQQAMGERPVIADDIYSLGATLYDLLTGKPPFYRGNIIAQVLQEPPAAMQERRTELGVADRPAIPAQWERMIAACLAKQPEDRPPSGAALLQLLDTSPHALVPYAPREEIALDSLRLDLSVIENPKSVIEAESDTVPVQVRPVNRYQPRVLKPESRIWGVMRFLGDELVSWGRRVVYLVTFVGIVCGLIYLMQAWGNLQSSRAPIIQIVAPEMVQMPAPPPQQMTVEVRYAQPPPPPPWGGQPPPPPPPPMGPPPGRGPR